MGDAGRFSRVKGMGASAENYYTFVLERKQKACQVGGYLREIVEIIKKRCGLFHGLM